MNFQTLKDQIVYMLDQGIVSDIYLARRSHALLVTISSRGKQLEDNAYTPFFAQLQGILADHFIIHVTKLFEPPQSQHPNISIPSLLKFIQRNRQVLDIVDNALVAQNLRGLGCNVDLSKLGSIALTDEILHHFKSTMPTPESSPDLTALKVLRDKRIAHREATDVSGFPTTTFAKSFSLVNYAEDFVCVIGSAYTSTDYGKAGENFHLTNDARASAIALEQLIDTLLKG